MFITALCFFVIRDLFATRDTEKDSAVAKGRLNLREILVVFYTFYYSDVLCGKKRFDITIFNGVSSVFNSHSFALDT